MTLPTVAIIRSAPIPALVLLDGNGSIASLVAEGNVLGCAWAPGAPILAYQRNGDLCIYQPQRSHETLLSGLAQPVRRNFSFNPRGDGIAVLADGALFALPVLDSFGSGRRVSLPPDANPIAVHWFRGGSALAVSCRREGHGSVVLVDLSTNDIRTLPADCELLAARQSDHRLVVRRIDPRTGEDEAGVLDDDGVIEALFRAPEGSFISCYLAGPDLFLIVESSEDTGDPTSLLLVTAGGLPGQPWLQQFPNLADWTFTPDGMLLAGLSRSDPDDKGDLVVGSVDGQVSTIRVASFAGEDEEYQHPTPADIPDCQELLCLDRHEPQPPDPPALPL